MEHVITERQVEEQSRISADKHAGKTSKKPKIEPN